MPRTVYTSFLGDIIRRWTDLQCAEYMSRVDGILTSTRELVRPLDDILQYDTLALMSRVQNLLIRHGESSKKSTLAEYCVSILTAENVNIRSLLRGPIKIRNTIDAIALLFTENMFTRRVTSKDPPLTPAFIMLLHGAVNGRYANFRTEYVEGHAAPEDIEPLMTALMDFMDAEIHKSIFSDSVMLVSIFLERFLWIKPFKSHNGILARLLVSTFLFPFLNDPFIFTRPFELGKFKSNKDYYNTCLDATTRGNSRPIVRYMLECTEYYLHVYRSR
jgi:hypothetical protein